MLRLSRFQRVAKVAPIHLTQRDREIFRLIHQQRFLRSRQIVALLGGSAQQLSRRLQRLFHHGYLERPLAQLQTWLFNPAMRAKNLHGLVAMPLHSSIQRGATLIIT